MLPGIPGERNSPQETHYGATHLGVWGWGTRESVSLPLVPWQAPSLRQAVGSSRQQSHPHADTRVHSDWSAQCPGTHAWTRLHTRHHHRLSPVRAARTETPLKGRGPQARPMSLPGCQSPGHGAEHIPPRAKQEEVGLNEAERVEVSERNFLTLSLQAQQEEMKIPFGF